MTELCDLLGVARSGYYAWAQTVESKQELMNRELSERITEMFNRHKGRYGSPRVTAALQREGHPCNHKRVERIMRQTGLQARSRKRWRPRTTDSQHTHPIAQNLLLERTAPKAINEVWVQDITYLPTAEGWLYLAGVLDLYSRRLIGWSMRESLETELPLAALDMALETRQHPAAVIHHSDRGCQYASQAYRQILQSNELVPSMSRKGNCYDNATMESFWSSIKTELLQEGLERKTRAEVRLVVFEYVEAYYNRERLHSSLGFKSPVEFENQLS